MLAIGNPEPIRSIQHDPALLVGERLPGRVHVEAVRVTHLIQDLERDLGVHQVAVGQGDRERPLAQRARRIGHQQLWSEPVLDTESLTERAGSVGVMKRKQRSPKREGSRLGGNTEAREQKPHQVVKLGEGADGGLGRACGVSLGDQDCRRKPLDALDLLRGRSREELARIRRERLQVSTLAFRTEGIERKRGLSRT